MHFSFLKDLFQEVLSLYFLFLSVLHAVGALEMGEKGNRHSLGNPHISAQQPLQNALKAKTQIFF